MEDLLTSPGFDLVFESSATGMVLLDLNGSIRRANRIFAGWLGLSVTALPSRNWWNLVYGPDLARCLAAISRLARGEAASVRFDARFVAEEHIPRWASVACSAVNPEARAPMVLAQVFDSAEHRRAEEEAFRQCELARLLQRDLAALCDAVASAPADDGLSPDLVRIGSRPLAWEDCDVSELAAAALRTVRANPELACHAWDVADLPPLLSDPALLGLLLESLLQAVAAAADPGHPVHFGSYLEDQVPVFFLRYAPARPADEMDGDGQPWARWPGCRFLVTRLGGAFWAENDNGNRIVCFQLESPAE